MKLTSALGFVVLTLCTTNVQYAQLTPSIPPSVPQPVLGLHPEWPKANRADVDTAEHTVRAFFRAISAPAGGKLNRDRLRSLFVPGGRIVAGVAPRAGRPADVILLTPDEYADRSDAATARNGFYDRDIANRIEGFGVMTHVYAAYESRSHLDDPKPMARGIKSFELLNGTNRWYIVQMYWDSERPDNMIPKSYLHPRSDRPCEPR